MVSKGNDLQTNYWFRAKKYGWGWGLPSNMRGWISFSLFFGIWIGALLWLVSSGSNTDQISGSNIAIFAVIFLADIAWFTYVSFRYGESPKWRWRNRHNATKSKSN